MAERKTPETLRASISQQRLPRWSELPDLELYMDQVLSLAERYLGACPGHKGLTAAMVNNYVKLGVIPPPVKKKYTRPHLAQLLMICVLKSVLPIDSVKFMFTQSFSDGDISSIYDDFCSEFEQSARSSVSALPNDLKLFEVYRAALRAQAEQTLALELYEALSGNID